MRVVIQRVSSSSVTVNGDLVGQIGRGLNILVGIAPTDTAAEIDWMVRKCLELRLFPGEANESKWEKSVTDIRGELLVVSHRLLRPKRTEPAVTVGERYTAFKRRCLRSLPSAVSLLFMETVAKVVVLLLVIQHHLMSPRLSTNSS